MNKHPSDKPSSLGQAYRSVGPLFNPEHSVHRDNIAMCICRTLGRWQIRHLAHVDLNRWPDRHRRGILPLLQSRPENRQQIGGRCVRSFVKQIAVVLLVAWVLGGYPTLPLERNRCTHCRRGWLCDLHPECTRRRMARIVGHAARQPHIYDRRIWRHGDSPNYCTHFLFCRSKN